MRLDRNNNNLVLYRIARNNLMSKKLSSFFSAVSIFLAVTLVATISLYITGYKIADEKILDKMQHVIYMHVTSGQVEGMSGDSRIEEAVPYKFCDKKFETDGIEYKFSFLGSNNKAISTYEITEGTFPQKYNEIVVDKAFMAKLNKKSIPGTVITLDMGAGNEEFIVTGFTDKKNTSLTYIIYTSKEFADRSPAMEKIPYEALVRFNNVDDMPYSTFTTLIYQVAAGYGIDRQNVNLNSKFSESLQSGNSGLFTVLFVAVLLFAAGSIVVYSIFYFSVVSRIQQIGQFQTIGMTPGQVKKMIRREGLLLSAFSIPSALLVSGITAYSLVSDGWSFKNYLVISVLTSIAGCFIVQISISRPASVAAKISPVEASRIVNSKVKEKPYNYKHKYLSPYTLAKIECRNNRKKWWLATVSLAFGGILFMVASTWNSSWDKMDYSRQSYFKNGEYYISYMYDHNMPETYGITDMQLTGHLDGTLKEKILNIPYVKDVLAEKSATGVIEYQGSTFTQPFYPLSENDSGYFQINADGNNNYEYMAENNAILVTNRNFTESINGIVFKPGEKITFRYFDGEEHSIELEIAAVSDETVKTSDIDRPDYYMADVTMDKLWKEMNITNGFIVSVEDYEKNGTQVESRLRKLLNGYEDLDFYTLREQLIEDSGLIKEYQAQIYGVSIFIILFSIFNLVNTVISSIVARKRELTLLESVGMEQGQISRMLLWESFLIALPNIIITLTAGTATGFGFICFMQRTASYLQYKFPLLAVVLYIIAMVFIPVVISLFCLKEQNKTSLAGRVKNNG